ncbi:MAG: restriction endonuclease subunit S [Firmicutes bacterium]|nr:restriction endonuclease subunit S [Bacillota bacterium]MCD7799483.1 restriction endonuclease subunit S [Akkermansiaceae bacterium]
MKYNTYTLSELATIKYGKNQKAVLSEDGNIPIYGTGGLMGYATKPLYDKPSVLIGRKGTIEKVHYVTHPFWTVDTLFYTIVNEDIIRPHYLYYLLSTLDLKQYNEGTTIPSLRTDTLNRIEFNVPDLKAQDDTLSVLEPIEEKIELNNEINKNLEQQAQAIFEDEFLSHDEPPHGWCESNLLAIADYLNGLAMQKFRPVEGESGLPVLKIKELRQGMCDINSELCSPNIKPEYIVHDGDVIFSWSGSLLVDFWCGGTCGLNQHLFKVTSTRYDKWFYYAWTKHHLSKFIALAADMATTMGHIKREELSKAGVLIPPTEDYCRIGSLLQPLYDMIISNRIENRQLAELRDELLPKLMSGEIDLS